MKQGLKKSAVVWREGFISDVLDVQSKDLSLVTSFYRKSQMVTHNIMAAIRSRRQKHLEVAAQPVYLNEGASGSERNHVSTNNWRVTGENIEHQLIDNTCNCTHVSTYMYIHMCLRATTTCFIHAHHKISHSECSGKGLGSHKLSKPQPLVQSRQNTFSTNKLVLLLCLK